MARKMDDTPARETSQAPGDTHRASQAGAGGRVGHERARDLTQLGGAARMLSPAPLRAGRAPGPAGGWGGGALAQPPLTGAGSAAAAALSARALPEPGLACAAAPQRRRRLLCSNGSSSGRHGQVQRGAHPRAARYEAAVVSGTPRPGASQTSAFLPRYNPFPVPPPRPLAACLPTPRQPLPLHPSSGCRCPRSILSCSPRLTLSGPSSSRASRPDLR